MSPISYPGPRTTLNLTVDCLSFSRCLKVQHLMSRAFSNLHLLQLLNWRSVYLLEPIHISSTRQLIHQKHSQLDVQFPRNVAQILSCSPSLCLSTSSIETHFGIEDNHLPPNSSSSKFTLQFFNSSPSPPAITAFRLCVPLTLV